MTAAAQIMSETTASAWWPHSRQLDAALRRRARPALIGEIGALKSKPLSPPQGWPLSR